MIVDYKSRKNEVLASYEAAEKLIIELRDYATSINLPDPTEQLVERLSDIRSKAERVKLDKFNIMVAGESKSGKSTFINAYLGIELLPMDVKQCTSSIVEIKYGETFSIRATYADERQITITGDDESRKFLKENAALDDDYRDIPVPTINSEILVKSGLRAREKGSQISISSKEIEAMLTSPEVQEANIHNLPDYNERITKYIEVKKDSWQDIVTKIEIMFPFGENLRGIEIIDSPGVCARGGVAEITSQYIKTADAIIFLKPVSGQALESTQFNQFMESVSDNRNQNALFLVLTRATNVTEADLRRLEDEAYKQFSKLDKKNILIIDSKAELYAKQFSDSDIKDIQAALRRLKQSGTLDNFVSDAYNEISGLFGDGNEEDFIEKLKEKSRFKQVYDALDTFGRKAHYIMLAALLDSINNLYRKLLENTNSKTDMFKQKAEDPNLLAQKIAVAKSELDIIRAKMYKGVDDVVRQFSGDEGIIKKEANIEVNDFLVSVGKIDPDSNDAFSKLESLSLNKINRFKELTEEVQHQAVAEFDQTLVELSDKSTISFESLKPDFTEATFKQLKESTTSKGFKTEYFEEGVTFKKTKSRSKYVQHKHFDIVNNDIQRRLDELKNKLIEHLLGFVENIRNRYIKELASNAEAKKRELDAIMEAKATAEQIRDIIQELTSKGDKLSEAQKDVNQIKGGILKYVQHNN